MGRGRQRGWPGNVALCYAERGAPFESFNTKSAAGGVDCTRSLGAVTLGFKHLKKPAIGRVLKQTDKRLLQPWRDYGVGYFSILL